MNVKNLFQNITFTIISRILGDWFEGCRRGFERIENIQGKILQFFPNSAIIIQKYKKFSGKEEVP